MVSDRIPCSPEVGLHTAAHDDQRTGWGQTAVVVEFLGVFVAPEKDSLAVRDEYLEERDAKTTESALRMERNSGQVDAGLGRSRQNSSLPQTAVKYLRLAWL